jgi:hypothetical protein
MVTGQDPDGEDPVRHQDVAVATISGEEPANDSVDSLHAHAPAAAGSSVPNDDFYPLGDAIQWYQQLYNPDDEQTQLLRHLLLPATEDVRRRRAAERGALRRRRGVGRRP